MQKSAPGKDPRLLIMIMNSRYQMASIMLIYRARQVQCLKIYREN
jgi:hypothetical protein